MKIIPSNENAGVVIKSWCQSPEQGAINQAINLSRLPFAFRQICLLPDTHIGYGMPIGGVIACEDTIIPNAVGVDIGCGLLAAKTDLTELNTETLKKIMGEIRERIPVGFSHNSFQCTDTEMPSIRYNGVNEGFTFHELPICFTEYEAAKYSMGTMGGGNHFCEIQRDTDGFIWFMIHSGSRNLGKKVADHYNKLAISLNEKWYAKVPKEWELAFLPVQSDEGQTYLREMDFCIDFALRNRRKMADIIMSSFSTLGATASEYINIHHNYVAIEHHFGKNLWVHRKGATSAKEGELGIVPGSQGTSSYIVRGKGNSESFMSCSHGAGRKMGRKQACRELDLEAEIKRLDDKGILHAIRGQNDLEEASGAYKDIDTVMEEQKDLVDIVTKLEPLGVIKG